MRPALQSHGLFYCKMAAPGAKPPMTAPPVASCSPIPPALLPSLGAENQGGPVHSAQVPFILVPDKQWRRLHKPPGTASPGGRRRCPPARGPLHHPQAQSVGLTALIARPGHQALGFSGEVERVPPPLGKPPAEEDPLPRTPISPWDPSCSLCPRRRLWSTL